MNRLTLGPIFLCVLLTGCASSAKREGLGTAAEAVTKTLSASFSFESVDTSADKKISREEFRAAVRRKFKELDRDQSGKLDAKTECTGFESTCRAADRNLNGAVSEDEFARRAEKEFRKADTDKDKSLSLDEFSGVVIFRF